MSMVVLLIEFSNNDWYITREGIVQSKIHIYAIDEFGEFH